MLLHNSTTKMKIYTIPIFVLMVGLLGYCVHQQAETRKHEELHQILKEVQHSTKLLNGKSAPTLIDLHKLFFFFFR